jgi:hypothetical protein
MWFLEQSRDIREVEHLAIGANLLGSRRTMRTAGESMVARDLRAVPFGAPSPGGRRLPQCLDACVGVLTTHQ